MLVLLVHEQVLIYYLELIYLAFLPHLAGYLGICFLVLWLFAEHNRTEYPFSKDIFSFSAIHIFQSLCVNRPLADLLADFHQKIKVLLINLVDLLHKLLFIDVWREIV
jgi:hypothetical protein